MSAPAPTTSGGFIRKAEEKVSEVAGVIEKEAEITEGLAETVEKIADELKSDVIKVKDAVHQIGKDIDSAEGAVDAVESTVNKLRTGQDLPSAQIRPPSKSSTNIPYWSVLRPIIHVVVAGISIVQLWPTLTSLTVTLTSSKAGGADQIASGPSSSTNSPKLSYWSLIYGVGPLVLAFNLIRKLMTNEKKIISELEENVDDVASKATMALDTVDKVAHVVKQVSEEVEKDAKEVQHFITEHKAKQ